MPYRCLYTILKVEHLPSYWYCLSSGGDDISTCSAFVLMQPKRYSAVDAANIHHGTARRIADRNTATPLLADPAGHRVTKQNVQPRREYHIEADSCP